MLCQSENYLHIYFTKMLWGNVHSHVVISSLEIIVAHYRKQLYIIVFCINLGHQLSISILDFNILGIGKIKSSSLVFKCHFVVINLEIHKLASEHLNASVLVSVKVRSPDHGATQQVLQTLRSFKGSTSLSHWIRSLPLFLKAPLWSVLVNKWEFYISHFQV